MARELPRTLYSLSVDYQRNIDPDEYEVIVVDNGSDAPIDPKLIDGLTGNFRVIRIDAAPASPAHAVNLGLAEARGEIVGVMIDGARIATPGLLHFARHGARLYDTAIVATLGWYLGHDFQGWSAQYGYDRAREDALLDSIDWPKDGYRLFEVGTMDESSVDGWFQPIAESNALFLRRGVWELLGGVDERFDAPGGGFINLDTFARALELPNAELVILLGEATFHQLHGGVATNSAPDRQAENVRGWSDEYAAVRGRPYEKLRPRRPPTYIGNLARPALARMTRAVLHPGARHFESALGPDFDKEFWTHAVPVRPADETVAGLVDIVRTEFLHGRFEGCCAVARLVCERAPDELEARRMLSLVALFVTAEGPAPGRRADYHLALGDAYRALGQSETAASHYREALTFNSDLSQAHSGLAMLRMPGDDYLAWLERFYRELAPETAIEIGTYQGKSLGLLRPPTIAIAVDPEATILVPLKTETHVFAETSDAFFAHRRSQKLLAGRPLSVGFIDGLHLYEQALRDFIGLEALCGPSSVLLMHDTAALDEPSQARTQRTGFYTGDVWKVVLALKHYRPDLDVFTIATPPTGLTVAIGLDASSTVLADRYEEIVARFVDAPFSSIESDLENALNIVPNDWESVRRRLADRQILSTPGVSPAANLESV